MTMQIDWGSETDTGRVRTNNEDSLLVRGDLDLAVLCDGMGGHRAGEVASRLAVDTFAAAFEESIDRLPGGGDLPNAPPEGPQDEALSSVQAVLFEAAGRANRSVLAKALSAAEFRGMGCTLVALHLREGGVSFVTVGDSRLYLLRAGRLVQVSEDHTRLRMLEQMGVHLDSVEAQRIRGVLTRAIGTQEQLEIDCGTGPTAAGDVWLLCSDGLTDEIHAEEIRSILASSETALEAARACVGRAVEAGGRDNVSVIVARVVAGSSAAGPIEFPSIETHPSQPGRD